MCGRDAEACEQRRYRPSVSGKDTSYVGRYVGFMTTLGGKAVALTVTPAHKWWEPDSGLVPASRAISAKVIRGAGVLVLLQVILRPGRSRTWAPLNEGKDIDMTAARWDLNKKMLEGSDLVWFAHSTCPPTARQETRHYRYLTATSITQGGLHESHTETQSQTGPTRPAEWRTLD